MRKTMCFRTNSGTQAAGLQSVGLLLIAGLLSLAFLACRHSNGSSTVESVTVSPATAEVAQGETETFRAVVNGKNNPPQTVTWTVEGGGPGTGTKIEDGILTVAEDETAETLTVTATSTQNTGKSGTATVTVTSGSDINLPPLTGAVTITGIAQVGQTIAVNIDNLGGDEGAISYQWLRCATTGADGAAIDGATSGTYVPVTADGNQYLKVRVSRSGYSGSVTSDASSKVLAADAPVPTVSEVIVNPATANVIRGNTQQFGVVITGANDPAQTVLWSVSGGGAGTNISGTGLLTVALNETATSLTVRATSAIDTGKSGTAAVTVEDLPALAGVVIITGYPQAGLSLTANTANLFGNGIIGFQWKRGDSAADVGTDIPGATTASYTMVSADVGAYISVSVSRSDRKGTLTSDSVGPVEAADDQAGTVQGTITLSDGVSREIVNPSSQGNSLPVNGSLSVTVNGSYQAYRWFVDGVEIDDETGRSLTLNGADYSVGQHRILMIVYRNGVPYSQDITFTVVQ